MFEHTSSAGIHERTVYKIQAIIKRPDGTLIRPEAAINEEQWYSATSLTDDEWLRILLTGYEQIDKSEILASWVELIKIVPQSTVIQLHPKNN